MKTPTLRPCREAARHSAATPPPFICGRAAPFIRRAAALVIASAAAFAAAEDTQLRTLGKTGAPRFDPPEITWPAAPGEAEICLWKDDKYAAVSLTIDDNCRPDHDWWLEQAAKHGFKLTWFVVTDGVMKGQNRTFNGTWEDWQRLADAGHSIQSHTTNHRSAPKDGPAIPDEEIHAMYRDSLAAINEHVTNNVACCIAYPSGEPHEEIAAQYAIACRGVYGVPNALGNVNYLNVSKGDYAQGYINVLLGEDADEPKWLNMRGRPLRRGWCATLHHFVHHGRTKEEVAESVAKSEAKLENLAKYKDRLWIDTFPAVAKYGQA